MARRAADRSAPGPRVARHHREGTGTVRIGYPIGIRSLRVQRKELLTPLMTRLVLNGPESVGFQSHQADDHVRIILPEEDGTFRSPLPNDQQELDWPHPSPISRKYTVRRYDPVTGEIDLDFVLHDGGRASDWVRGVAVGDEVVIAGPPGAKAFPHHFDHYVFAVDSTALPALARWLDENEGPSAQVVIETEEAIEQGYPLTLRDNIETVRLVRAGGPSRLAAVVQQLELPAARTFLFAAGEADDIKPLRSWSKGRLESLITGYWKRGVADLDD